MKVMMELCLCTCMFACSVCVCVCMCKSEFEETHLVQSSHFAEAETEVQRKMVTCPRSCGQQD